MTNLAYSDAFEGANFKANIIFLTHFDPRSKTRLFFHRDEMVGFSHIPKFSSLCIVVPVST